jgi:hypothetical protein
MVNSFRDVLAQATWNCVPLMIDNQGKPIMYGKHFLFSHFNHYVTLIADKKFKKFGLVHRSGKILAEPIYDKIETDIPHHYPYISTVASQNAYWQNLRSFSVPKIEKGKVKATIEDKKNYSSKTTLLEIQP